MQHSKASLTSSSINLAMPKCENTFFYTQDCLKITQKVNPIEVRTNEPKCSHNVGPSVCLSAQT